jgi:hypothetical protein
MIADRTDKAVTYRGCLAVGPLVQRGAVWCMIQLWPFSINPCGRVLPYLHDRPEGQTHHQNEHFAALVDRLAASKDLAEKSEIKVELACLTFGE